MHTVLIVDDDYPVLEYLGGNIPWEELGLTLIGLYENGEEALDAAKKVLPDIVITDIGMPIMNGLQLIDEIKKINEDLLSIIVSCHDDFQFAQRAIDLDVNKYILKETMEIEVVIEQLQHCKSILMEKNAVSHMNNEKENDYSILLKRDWIRFITHQTNWDLNRWNEYGERYGFYKTGYNYVTIMGYNYKDNIFRKHLKAKQSQTNDYKDIKNVIQLQPLSPDERFIFFPNNESHFFLFYAYQQKSKYQIQTIKAKLLTIQNELKIKCNFDVSFIIGETFNYNDHLKNKLKAQILDDEQFFYLRKGTISQFVPMHFSKNYISYKISEVLHLLIKHFFDMNRKEMDSFILNILLTMKRNQNHPSDVKLFLGELMKQFQLKVKEVLSIINVYHEDSYEYLYSIQTIDELHKFLKDYLEHYLLLIDNDLHDSKMKYIVHAQKYVIANIEQKITLSRVAKKLHLNQSYLSRIFKEVTGESFITYVTRMKVSRAKELLSHNISFDDVSDVLEYDKVYFHKLFRKSTGMTPGEYIKLNNDNLSYEREGL